MATQFGRTKKKFKGKMATTTFAQKTRNYTAKKSKLFFPIIALHTVVEKQRKVCTSINYSGGQACGNKFKES